MYCRTLVGTLRRSACSARLRALPAALVVAAGLVGCSRHFYRERADCDVNRVLCQKDQYPQWKIQNAHVYPDPRARFADPTNPDRPPKPPDDSAAECLSPNPQKPGKAGIARIEGTGYLDILKGWDAQNRAEDAGSSPQPATSADTSALPAQTESTNADTARALPAFRIRMEQAAELGLINSREYQDRREDLYIAALPVTLERFAFAPHFFAAGEAIREWSGRNTPDGHTNRWVVNTNQGFTQLFSTGALLLLNIANQTIIDLTGSPSPRTISQSTLTLDLMQPFLRGGGRAVTLEPLTQSERNLLYVIRNYARFRKEFFVWLVGGASLPSATSFSVSTAVVVTPSSQFSLPTGAVGRIEGTSGVGLSATGPVSNVTAAGYLPTLEYSALVMNDVANVTALRGFLKLFEAFKEGGDVSQLQVDQVEQQLLQGQSQVLQDRQNYEMLLDDFKIQLGIPPVVALQLDDAPIRSLSRQFEQYLQVFREFDAARDQASAKGPPPQARELRLRLRQVLATAPLLEGVPARERLPRRWAGWEELNDIQLDALLRQLARERRHLLDQQADYQQAGKSIPAENIRRVTEVELEIDLGTFEKGLREYEREPWKLLPDPARQVRQQIARFQRVVNDFTLILSVARTERLDQRRKAWPELPPLLVSGVDLLTAENAQAEAVVAQTALLNRLDLMNARAMLVDAWRKIAVAANALLGVLNLEYRFDSFTPPNADRPLAFGGSGNRNELILNWQLPLVRVAERNTYREVLIAYQRQRRALMEAEDLAVAQVRQELRELRILAENYKIQQRQVELAYATVESSLDTFRAPPGPPTSGGPTSTAVSAASLTQQLLSAQSSLPRAQNALIAVWVQYLVVRLELYRDLELMEIDSRGVWLDETTPCAARPTSSPATADRDPNAEQPEHRGERGDQPEHLPPPNPFPSPEAPPLDIPR